MARVRRGNKEGRRGMNMRVIGILLAVGVLAVAFLGNRRGGQPAPGDAPVAARVEEPAVAIPEPPAATNSALGRLDESPAEPPAASPESKKEPAAAARGKDTTAASIPARPEEIA
ncbi:MAG: hypothetical protein ACKOTB_16390, partial [Planctomycetia bacterium]